MFVVVVAFFGSLVDARFASGQSLLPGDGSVSGPEARDVSVNSALGEVKLEMWEMEANDFWTFVGLVIGAFAIVVAPRLFQPGHTANSVIYLTGGTVVLVVASIARWRTRRKETEAAESGAHDQLDRDAVQ
jgi:hypothetical protein